MAHAFSIIFRLIFLPKDSVLGKYHSSEQPIANAIAAKERYRL
jgi:hypothetical protein